MSDPVSQNKVSSEEHLRLSSSLNMYIYTHKTIEG